MTTQTLYQLPVDITQWHFDGQTEVLFNWEYDDGSADLLKLWQESIDTGGPRPASAYWATIVNATLNKWHPANSVNPDSTPQSSASFIEDALKGKVLL